jgi:hypothetical protein
MGEVMRMNARLLLVMGLFFAVRANADQPFVAHEWGTFTSVQGSDGVQRQWLPAISTDLPEFVYSRAVNNGGFTAISLSGDAGKDSFQALVRMETPVIYFYSATQREVDVRVDFPEGRITEWYPQATNIGPHAVRASRVPTPLPSPSLIEWNDVQILAPDTTQISAGALIRSHGNPQADHYYAARATDANFLRVGASPDKVEHERDLFYRGIGFFPAPLSLSMDAAEKELVLTNAYSRPLGNLFVLTIQKGKVRYRKLDSVAALAHATIKLEPQSSSGAVESGESLTREVALALVEQGLYPKEAAAMVQTWKDQWFAEEGTRVLYLLPRAWTDRMLPLTISPQPDSIVRVMVGRAELIPPAQERELRKQIMAFAAGDASAKRQATKAVSGLGLGRFLNTAVQIATAAQPDPMQTAGLELLMEITAADSARSAAR